MNYEPLQQAELFAGKEWRLSPTPFLLTAKETEELEKLGHRLLLFYRASNTLYQQSLKGKKPEWIADYLDRGKPEALLELAHHKAFRDQIPSVIRPDLILTEEGFSISELDSVPGGIGLTAWLQEVYAPYGFDLLGGKTGMIEGFRSILPGGADILISEEAFTYRPEMEWLANRLNALSPEIRYQVESAETYTPSDRAIYRFFELWDLHHIPAFSKLIEPLLNGQIQITPPLKPHFEEKLWLALFWSHPLREIWRRELSERQWLKLQTLIPFGWVIDPAPLPHNAVLPKLNIQNWTELGHFSQKERELVLKISGFSETAWGSRGVTIGQDVSQHDWKQAVQHAIDSFPHHPFVLQEFKRAKIIEHPWYNPETGKEEIVRGRVRLCPYYFVSNQQAKLGGVLCTIVPADKKIIHGMRDAILVPCATAA